MGNKFRLGRKIGSGSFGEIYLGSFILLLLLSFLSFLSNSSIFNFWVSRVLVSDTAGLFFCSFFLGTNIQTNEEVAIKLVSIFAEPF